MRILHVVTDLRLRGGGLAVSVRGLAAALARRGAGHFLHLRLPFEQYAQLDAMVALLGQARVGDFEVDHGPDTHVVTEDELAETLHRLDQFRAHPLLHELLTEEGFTELPLPRPSPLEDAVVDAGIRHYLSWRGSWIRY